MKFVFQINLSLVNPNSSEDLWNLSNLFEDCSLASYIDDIVYSKYTYFIRNNEKIIGFVYFMQYKKSDIYTIEYAIKKSEFNIDYIYTLLTIIRDKIKGYHETKEIEKATIVSKTIKNSKDDQTTKLFGNHIYSDDYYNYYEVNPNCENLEQEKTKILKFLDNHKSINK